MLSERLDDFCIYIYIYIYMCVCVCVRNHGNLEVKLHDATAVRSLTPSLKPSKYDEQVMWDTAGGASTNKLIRDVLLWTPTHGRVIIGRPGKTYLHQLCMNTYNIMTPAKLSK